MIGKWTKIDDNERDENLQELGCPCPGSTRYYSYHAIPDDIRWQPCVRLASRLKKSATKQYSSVQHFSIETACSEATEVLCVRHPNCSERPWTNKLIVTKHKVGECPLCSYFTKEQYNAAEYERLVKLGII